VERWLNLGYEWYHFGVHPVSELVYYGSRNCWLATTGQHFGCPLSDVFGENMADWSRVPGRVPHDQTPSPAGWSDDPLSDHRRAGHRLTGQGHGRRVLRRMRLRSNSTSSSTKSCICADCPPVGS
jgi:hypothetical protein